MTLTFDNILADIEQDITKIAAAVCQNTIINITNQLEQKDLTIKGFGLVLTYWANVLGVDIDHLISKALTAENITNTSVATLANIQASLETKPEPEPEPDDDDDDDDDDNDDDNADNEMYSPNHVVKPIAHGAKSKPVLKPKTKLAANRKIKPKAKHKTKHKAKPQLAESPTIGLKIVVDKLQYANAGKTAYFTQCFEGTRVFQRNFKVHEQATENSVALFYELIPAEGTNLLWQEAMPKIQKTMEEFLTDGQCYDFSFATPVMLTEFNKGKK